MPHSPQLVLVEFLDGKVFQPALRAGPKDYPAAARELLSSVQRRVSKTRTKYFSQYPDAAAVKRNFLSDMRTDAGKNMSSDMAALRMTTFEVVGCEFLSLCRKLRVEKLMPEGSLTGL